MASDGTEKKGHVLAPSLSNLRRIKIIQKTKVFAKTNSMIALDARATRMELINAQTSKSFDTKISLSLSHVNIEPRTGKV